MALRRFEYASIFFAQKNAVNQNWFGLVRALGDLCTEHIVSIPPRAQLCMHLHHASSSAFHARCELMDVTSKLGGDNRICLKVSHKKVSEPK